MPTFIEFHIFCFFKCQFKIFQYHFGLFKDFVLIIQKRWHEIKKSIWSLPNHITPRWSLIRKFFYLSSNCHYRQWCTGERQWKECFDARLLWKLFFVKQPQLPRARVALLALATLSYGDNHPICDVVAKVAKAWKV